MVHDTVTRKDLALHNAAALPKDFKIDESHYPFFYFTTEQNFLKEPQNVLAQVWHRADDNWFTEDEQERTRAIVGDPLKRVG